jgi:hypothetical protein
MHTCIRKRVYSVTLVHTAIRTATVLMAVYSAHSIAAAARALVVMQSKTIFFFFFLFFFSIQSWVDKAQ